MKKLNTKGFTLIELLAVVTIMGILMLVAIPAVARTIENTRRDTFLDTAKKYASSVKTQWLSDGLECTYPGSGTAKSVASALDDGNYYVLIDSSIAAGSNPNYPVLLEDGGKSSWGNRDVEGYVLINVHTPVSGDRKVTFDVVLIDGIHGVKELTDGSLNAGSWSGTSLSGMNDFSTLKRSAVVTSGADSVVLPTGNICTEI